MFRAPADSTENSEEPLKYNAMRWLRDSYFRPTDFDLANVAPEDREKVTKGLVKYAVWFGEFKDAPGKLPLSLLSEHSDDWMMEYEAFIGRPPYNWLLDVALLAMALGGVLLLRRASKS